MVAMLLTAASAEATNYTWTGSTNSNWDTATNNWSGNFVSGAGNAAVFNLGSPMNVTLTTGITLNGITFGTSNTTIGGNTLTFSGTSPTLSVGTGITATIMGRSR